MADNTLTWLGHASFRLDTSGGKRVYVDPFLNGNPKCPENELEPERADIIALTHGHGDHVGDTVAIAQKHGSTVVALVELAGWLGRNGVDEGKLRNPNKGGTEDRRRRQDLARERVPLRICAGRLLCGRAVGARRRDRGRQVDLLRGRYVRLRRHAAHRPDLPPRRRRPSDRRPLHDGAARGVGRDRAARRQARRPLPLGHVRAADGNARPARRPGGSHARDAWSPEARSPYEGALVRRDRQARSRARARGGGGRRRGARPRRPRPRRVCGVPSTKGRPSSCARRRRMA